MKKLTVLALAIVTSMLSLSAQQGQRPAAPQGYITGVVQSDNGAEAGVWVIAQTSDLPTPFIKIVVTDDRGRFVLPELPAATYGVWVRGYGLVDSSPTSLKPGVSTRNPPWSIGTMTAVTVVFFPRCTLAESSPVLSDSPG